MWPAVWCAVADYLKKTVSPNFFHPSRLSGRPDLRTAEHRDARAAQRQSELASLPPSRDEVDAVGIGRPRRGLGRGRLLHVGVEVEDPTIRSDAVARCAAGRRR
ncbi:MAG: hypothetical protein AAB932_06300, partial [Patescibacteria group bacterium]